MPNTEATKERAIEVSVFLAMRYRMSKVPTPGSYYALQLEYAGKLTSKTYTDQQVADAIKDLREFGKGAGIAEIQG